MKRTMMVVGAVAGVALLVPLISSAQGPGYGRGRGWGRGMGWGPGGCPGGCGMGPGRMAMLNLSNAQQKQLAKLRAEHRAKVDKIRTALNQKRTEMRKLWAAATVDRAAIVAKHAEMDPLRAKLREARVDFRLAMRNVLTPAQRAKARKGPGPGWGRGWRGRGPGPRGPGWKGRGRGGPGWGRGWRHRHRGGWGGGPCWNR